MNTVAQDLIELLERDYISADSSASESQKMEAITIKHQLLMRDMAYMDRMNEKYGNTDTVRASA
jgi:flagellar biosynthesis/type III secretory pathway chaperone